MGPSSSTRVPKGCRLVLKDQQSFFNRRSANIHWPSLDGSDKQPIPILVRLLNKVFRRLFSRYSNERYTFIGGFKPDNLGSRFRFVPLSLIPTFFPLEVLLLFRSCARRPEYAQLPREELSRHALDLNYQLDTTHQGMNLRQQQHGPQTEAW